MVKFTGKLRSDKFKQDAPVTQKKREDALPPALDEIRSALVQGARLRCSRCRGFGHIADDCTVEEVAPVNERCFKCGEGGHLARQCSRKGSLNAFAPGRQEMREYKRKLRMRQEEATLREAAAKEVAATRETRDGRGPAGKAARPQRANRFEAAKNDTNQQVSMEDLDRQLNAWNETA